MDFESYIHAFDTPSIVLLSLSVLGLLYLLLIYQRRLRTVRRHIAHCTSVEQGETIRPSVSVIVHAYGDVDALELMLADVCSQQMPMPYEVVVVGDGSAEDYGMVVRRMQSIYPHIRYTYVPDGSRVISRRKLAITLGVKASSGTVVVITDSSARIASTQWLDRMTSPFADPAIEVVIGYNTQYIPQSKWAGRLIRAFDNAADDVTWLASAISGDPYRASGTNVAYRRDLFFDHKGFSSSLNLKYGDDDLFINEITRPDNTYVQLSDDAIGTEGFATSVGKRLRHRRRTHAFTGRKLPMASRRIMAIGEWLMWLIPLLAVAGAILAGMDNIIGWAIAGIIILTMLISTIITWRKTLSAMHSVGLCLLIPLLTATRPLRNVINNVRATASKTDNYSWQ